MTAVLPEDFVVRTEQPEIGFVDEGQSAEVSGSGDSTAHTRSGELAPTHRRRGGAGRRQRAGPPAAAASSKRVTSDIPLSVTNVYGPQDGKKGRQRPGSKWFVF